MLKGRVMMRIGVAGCYHETNTFAPGYTDLEAFGLEWVVGKEEFVKRYQGSRTSMGGIIDASCQFGFEAVPILYADAMPSSMITQETMDQILNELISHIERHAANLDGLLLIVHGAMAAESCQDVEGELLRRIRSVLPWLPIAVTLDSHANISQAMVDFSDILVGYDTYPHIDAHERAVEACGLLMRVIHKQIRPVRYYARTDLLIALPLMNTNVAPMKDLMDIVFAMEQNDDVLNITVAGGYPFADVFCVGTSIVVTTDRDPELAERLGRELVHWIRERRMLFTPRLRTVEDACALIAANGQYPAVLIESSDNVGGGAPADATHVLRYLLEKRDRSFLIMIRDPEAVEMAEKMGVGRPFAFGIGGKTDANHGQPLMHGEPVTVSGKIRLLSDGNYKHKGPYMTGAMGFMGKTAVIRLDPDEQSAVILTELREAPWDINHVLSVGLDPLDFDIIVVKAAVAWRAAFGPIAKQAIEVDTPGCCSSNLSHFTYRNLPESIEIISGVRS